MSRATDRDETEGVRATRIVLSHPEGLSSWGRDRLEDAPFLTWLARTHDAVEEGEVWEEFVDTGCCGASRDVSLHVEAVEGPPRIGEETEIEYTSREGSEDGGGWAAQSDDEDALADE